MISWRSFNTTHAKLTVILVGASLLWNTEPIVLTSMAGKPGVFVPFWTWVMILISIALNVLSLSYSKANAQNTTLVQTDSRGYLKRDKYVAQDRSIHIANLIDDGSKANVASEPNANLHQFSADDKNTDDVLKTVGHESVVDLSGSYRLVKNINFQEYLACQGIGWAKRVAADAIITTTIIKQTDDTVTIGMSGIISSSTTYPIDGDPIESKVGDCVFQDTVKCMESGLGLRTTKVNEKYVVYIERTLTRADQCKGLENVEGKPATDQTMLVVRSKAVFKDGKEVEAIQYLICINE